MAATSDLSLDPLFMDIDSTYSGDEMGLVHRGVIGEGIVSSTAFAVTEKGAGADMSVDIAAGAAWIEGDDDTAAQPIYRCRSASTVNLTVSAADATNPRIDRVVLEVLDSTFTGASQVGRLEVLAGTPAASPSAPALPDTAISLATIAVAANETAITDAEITDLRQPMSGDVQSVGMVAPFYGSAPFGFLAMDGSSVSTSKYPRLASFLSEAGASMTLPDLRDKFLAGAGSTYSVGDTGGADSVTLTAAQSGLPAHTHPGSDITVAASSSGYTGSVRVAGSDDASSTGTDTTSAADTGSNSSASASSSHENRPPYHGVTFAIRV